MFYLLLLNRERVRVSKRGEERGIIRLLLFLLLVVMMLVKELMVVVVGELVGCLLKHSVLAGWHSLSKEPRNKRRRRRRRRGHSLRG